MGAQILLHFSKQALTDFIEIIGSYAATLSQPGAESSRSENRNQVKTLEENQNSLEEISSRSQTCCAVSM